LILPPCARARRREARDDGPRRGAAFGRDIDYATIVKAYEEQPAGRGRYSPPRIVSIEKDEKMGWPNMDAVSTSLVERQNLTVRM
jgi:hypothetical protein